MTCGQVKPGDTVLTLGTGGVSRFALQFAKLAGARVIATSSPEEKLEKLEALGADDVISYKAEPGWGQKAKDLTDGRGGRSCDRGRWTRYFDAIDNRLPDGRAYRTGRPPDRLCAEVSIPALFSNQIRISGISIGSRADQEDMVRAIDVNGLKPVIDGSFPLQNIGAAFEHYESKKHFGKVCLEL